MFMLACAVGTGRCANARQPRSGSQHVAVFTIQFEIRLRWRKHRVSGPALGSRPVLEQRWHSLAVLA